jgi:hypothetical protein
MLPAVCLDNQLGFQADEVDNVRFDRFLATELKAGKTAAAQVFP